MPVLDEAVLPGSGPDNLRLRYRDAAIPRTQVVEALPAELSFGSSFQPLMGMVGSTGVKEAIVAEGVAIPRHGVLGRVFLHLMAGGAGQQVWRVLMTTTLIHAPGSSEHAAMFDRQLSGRDDDCPLADV